MSGTIGRRVRGTIRHHPLAAPIATAAAVGSAWITVAALGPDRVMPLACPLLSLTGLACPFCGGLRAAHALAHGDVIAAAGYNVVAVAAAPVLTVVWASWLVRRGRGDPRPMLALSGRALLVLAVLLVAFAVTRNLPVGHWLAL